MKMILFGDSKSYKVTNWAGGKTSEIMIFPFNANYAKRNFDFRISQATTTDKDSLFTSLPGYQRILMPLEKDMNLNINDHKMIVNKFSTVRFNGSDQVRSFNANVDFNIMTNDNWKSELQLVDTNKVHDLKATFTGFFCAEGSGKLLVLPKGISLNLNYKDCIIFEKEDVDTIVFKDEDANFKVIKMSLKRRS